MLVLFEDGTWNYLSKAIVFDVPPSAEEEFSNMSTGEEIAKAIEDGTFNVIARLPRMI